MKENIFQTQIQAEKVLPNPDSIYRGMGYFDNEIPLPVRDITEELMIESEDYINVCGGYRIFLNDSVIIEKDRFYLKNVVFKTDRIIGNQLKKSKSMIFLVATLGINFDLWVKEYFDSGDPLKGFIADTIGSETVENAADYLEELIVQEIKNIKMGCTNRYSPGYCGWNVSEQHNFFSLLPNNFCGIELSPSALMKPIKSVSAVIGIGPECKKKEYQCSLCDLQDCYKRNRKSVAKNNQ